MPAKSVIRDIRYFESEEFGKLGDYVGALFPFNSMVFAAGNRIAEKLREYGFVMGDFHHLYIVFTPTLPEDAFQFDTRAVYSWYKCVYFGADPVHMQTLNVMEKEQFVIASTLAILTSLCEGDINKRQLVEQVRVELLRFGAELEIVRKTKETASYKVVVTFQIAPHPHPSVGLIEYTDKKTGLLGKKAFVKLTLFEDIYFLVGVISVSKGTIWIKPRTSFQAKLYTKRYKVPISVPIIDLLHPSLASKA